MLIMGVDPGLARMGYGFISMVSGSLETLDYGVIETAAGQPQHLRLHCLFEDMNMLIDKFSPAAVAVEKLYFHRNVTTAMAVSEGRGVVLLAAARKNLELFEYTPLQVKQAVVGYGRAAKEQVQNMVCMQLGLKTLPRPDDAADALAVALCHFQSFRWQQMIGGTKVD